MDENNSLETIWDALLSKENERVRSIYLKLDKDSRRYAVMHLQSMAEEEGWHPLQKAAAQAALECIQELAENGEEG